jgi:hypothetical protein
MLCCEDLSRESVEYDLGDGLIVPGAALEDIIRSKEAANREKDCQAPADPALIAREAPRRTSDT